MHNQSFRPFFSALIQQLRYAPWSVHSIPKMIANTRPPPNVGLMLGQRRRTLNRYRVITSWSLPWFPHYLHEVHVNSCSIGLSFVNGHYKIKCGNVFLWSHSCSNHYWLKINTSIDAWWTNLPWIMTTALIEWCDGVVNVGTGLSSGQFRRRWTVIKLADSYT